MDKIKRLLLFRIPTSICNFRCHYCYLAQREVCYQGEQAKMQYTPEEVAYALRPERLGGLAYMNFCADGETLLSKDIDKYILELVKMGHYAEIVTNATITPMIEKILSWDKDLLKRVSFKCSFHYLELKKKNLLDVFANNVKNIWETGASANIEITPTDEIIPLINEIKVFSLENFGALPHLTIARNDRTKKIDYLTKLSLKEYCDTWSQFKSEFWEFKQSIFKKRVKDFCYAGDWSLYIDLASGETTQCYCSNYIQNIFKKPENPIRFEAIGRCKIAHCYNGHALMTMGCVPHFTDTKYGDIRNRIISDEKQWLQPELLKFFNTTLVENNREYTPIKKFMCMVNGVQTYPTIFFNKIRRVLKRKCK